VLLSVGKIVDFADIGWFGMQPATVSERDNGLEI